MSYRSDLPPDELARWHERAYQSMREAGEQRLSYLDLDLVIPAGVFAPTPIRSARPSRLRPSGRVLLFFATSATRTTFSLS